MAADGNQTQLMTAIEAIVLGNAPRPAMREPQRFRTLFTTQNHDDAICAGFERAEEELGEEGGFALHFDGRGLHPTLVVNGVDGQVDICGYEAIKQFAEAAVRALGMAGRMTGRV